MTCRLTVLLLLGAAAAGCSADPAASTDVAAAAPPAAAAAARLSACDLLTAAEVTSIIGQTVLEPQPNGFECAFRREGEGGLLVRAVRLRLEQGTVMPHELYEQYTTAIRTALDGEYEPESVAGIGTVAGWDGDALLTAEEASGQSFMLVVQLDDVDAAREQTYAEAIARSALTRLRTLAP